MAPSVRYESEDVSPDSLGKPLHFVFSGLTAKNRFLKAAMTERISSWDPKDLPARGIPSKNLINVYKRWGEGEFGDREGNIMINLNQLEAAGNPIIPIDAEFSGERFEAFKELADQSKKHGSLIVGQLSHPGRQVESRIQKDPVSASDVQLGDNQLGMTFEKPHAASIEEIEHIKQCFFHAAEFLYKAGYHGAELHGAHGYLLSQFLSPTTNHRTDNYGGTLENRSRIILEIAELIREKLPSSFVLGIKINSVEFQDEGFNQDEAKQLCANLEAHKFDFVELSGGTYEQLAFQHKRESTKKRESFFLDFAEVIVPGLEKTRTYITGGLKTVGGMVNALKTVDGVGLARPVCQEFYLPKDILSGAVKGAIKQRLDDQNFGITNVAAGTFIRQVGKDQQPIDLSQEKYEEVFRKDMGEWNQKMSHDTGMYSFGYVDIESTKTNPFGEAY
ncbi:hypothetical protein MMC13_001313 [Lambiella insularis]|nr:hypothetical protein [Lambiella insularis]